MYVLSLRTVCVLLLCLLSPVCFSQQDISPSARARAAMVRFEGDGDRGCGFIVRKDGLVMTAWHVIAGQIDLQAHLENGKTVRVSGVVKADRKKDYALLKLEGTSFPVMPLGKVGRPFRKQEVITLGYPEEEELQTSWGSLRRVQTSPVLGRQLVVEGQIKGGFSGGPVLNSRGEALGIAIQGSSQRFLAVDVHEVLPLPAVSASVTPLKTVAETYSESAEADFEAVREIIGEDEELSQIQLSLGSKLGKEVAGKFAEARQYLESAIRKRADYVQAYFALGLIYMSNNELTAARQALEKVVRLSPEDIDAIQMLGFLAMYAKQFDKARGYLNRTIKLDPTAPELYHTMGIIEWEAGQYKQVIPWCKKVIQRKPDHANAYLLLGLSYMRLEQYEKALAASKRAAALTPKDLSAFPILGLAHFRLGRPREALAAWKKAEELQSNYPMTTYFLGLAYERIEAVGESGGVFSATEATHSR